MDTMQLTKQYRMKKKLDEGTFGFVMSETTTIGCWILEVESSEISPTIYMVAGVASDILCDQFPRLTEEKIEQLTVNMRVGTERISVELEKGYSRQRVLDGIANRIRVR